LVAGVYQSRDAGQNLFGAFRLFHVTCGGAIDPFLLLFAVNGAGEQPKTAQ
jgi:hypothetical protein